MSQRLPRAVTDSYGTANLTAIKEKIDAFNAQFPGATAVPSTSGDSGRSSTSRVLCRPVFGPDEQPVNINRTVLPSNVLTSSELASTKEFIS